MGLYNNFQRFWISKAEISKRAVRDFEGIVDPSCTDMTVKFVVTLSENEMREVEEVGFHKKFKLESYYYFQHDKEL